MSGSSETPDGGENAPESVSKWKALIDADDPRLARFRKLSRRLAIIAFSIVILLAVWVFVSVPWDTTIEFRERNSGAPFRVPTVFMLALPLVMTPMMVAGLREKPKSLPYWEYRLGLSIISIGLVAIVFFQCVGAYGYLDAADQLRFLPSGLFQ
ncbi:MAG: hypothetical protein AB7V10_00435 [Leucobacter sp.]|jgi:cytochrome bd-type quinol oxidase subunit 2